MLEMNKWKKYTKKKNYLILDFLKIKYYTKEKKDKEKKNKDKSLYGSQSTF